MAIARAIPRWAVDTLRMALVLAVGLTVFSVYFARGENHDQTFYGCLYAGSLSQVNTVGPPASCGRGTHVQWNSQGIQGLPGEDGVSGYEVVEDEDVVTLTPGNHTLESVSCPEGKVVLGGGVRLYEGSSDGMTLVESYPHPNGTAWSVRVRNESNANTGWILWATCAFMAPAEPT